MSHEVFISYSHKDKAIVDAICHQFENDKLKCWIASRDITPGDNWAESIASAIPECSIFLLIFSAHSNMSKQVLREVELAVSNGLIIVPARIEDIKPSGGMAYYLSTVHWIEVMDDEIEKKLNILSATVKDLLKSGSKPIGKGTPPVKLKMPVKSIRKKRSLVWIPITAVVVIVGIMLFVFNNSNSNNRPQYSFGYCC